MIALDLAKLLGFKIVVQGGAAAVRSPKIGVKDARKTESVGDASR